MPDPDPDRARATSPDHRAPAPVRLLDGLVQDVRFARRSLGRSLGFTAMAAAVLALAIGANAAIFSLVDALMLRPSGVAGGDRQVRVFSKSTVEADRYRTFSYPNYEDLRAGTGMFERIAAFTPSLVGLDRGDGTVRREFAEVVTADYFATLGAEPVIGRTFTAEEERPNAGLRSVVIGHALWRRSGADPQPLGKPLRINGEEYTIVGVTPEGFNGVSVLLTTDVFLPIGVYGTSVGQFMASRSLDLSSREAPALMVIGRLRPGVVAEAVQPELDALAERMAADHPEVNRDFGLALGPQGRFSISDRPSSDTTFTAAGVVLLAMAGIVLLVACLNLANMFLARGAARRSEIAIRQSLGAGRGRLLRQLLTEGLLVSLAGGAVGILLGVWAARWVVASVAPVIPFGSFSLGVGLDLRVVTATLGFCLLSTLLFAFGPSLELVRSAVVDDLKETTARHSAGRGRRMMPRNALVTAQIALSLALVTAAGLFLRSVERARDYRPDFAADRGVLIELDTVLASLERERSVELYRQVLERMRSQPGVEAAALASNVPFSSLQEGDDVRLPGASDDEAVDAERYIVTDGYFDAMGLPLLAGRDFEPIELDSGAARAVAVVDEPLARGLVADGDVVGRSLVVSTPRGDTQEITVEIVGVVPGVRRALFAREVRPTLYLPFGANYRGHMIVHLRVDRPGDAAAAAVLESAGREIRAIDPRLPILSMKTFEDHLEQGIERWMVRTGAAVFGAMGAVAVLLALVGVYGVKSYLVSRRTREIGIRMALGATPREILVWSLRDGLVATAVGIGVGLVLALGVGRVLSSALYGVSGLDLVTFVAAPTALAAAALLAAYLPSRRATRLQPSAALREE